MALNRNIEKINLVKNDNIAVDIVIKNKYTHTIEITQLPSNVLLQTISLDPEDHTIVGSIGKNVLEALGETNSKIVLDAIAQVFLSKLGSKEMILIPDENTLPNFVLPEEQTKCDRMRHANRAELMKSTKLVLDEYKEFLNKLNEHYHFISSENNLLENRKQLKRYEELRKVLGETDFTSAKMKEYQGELQKIISRFKNECVKPIFALDNQNAIKGLIRRIPMGNKFCYLSDEVMIEDETIKKMLPLDQFKGETEKERELSRKKFLLAYLIYRTGKFSVDDYDHFIIIAAREREKIYDDIGFKKFPLNVPGWKLVMNFDAPKPTLQNLKQQIESLPLVEPIQYGKYIPAVGLLLFGATVFVANQFLQENSTGIKNIFKPN